ncbi:MAG: hypothetical protein JXB62_14295 [Pirellulales bacterium]|nr:hypothetical protein [Pirellulales bacterium]
MNIIARFFVAAAIVSLFLWLFADALFRSGMFAFRDAAHFYYPLFQLVRDEWAAGRVPLWNPYENLGQPLAGNPTASVFYPGKLIFALPLDYGWAYKIYIMTHVLLAAWAAYRLARHFGAGATAAGVCAISYAFSGNVLFQYCNVVFLVGAAWLPLAMLAADRMLLERSPPAAVGLGAVLALMVLGGDPQMAYNAGLLAAMYGLWLWWCGSSLALWPRIRGSVNGGEAPVPKASQPEPRRTGGGVPLARSRPALLAIAAAVGLILSAVQVLPSLEFARCSGRHADRAADRLLAKGLDPGTHGEHIYHFSVGPWRLAEYVWPNVGGRQFPVHRRWLDVLPAEGRIWTPSLYMGLLPLLLALSAMRFRRCRRAASELRGLSPCEDVCPTARLPQHDARTLWLTWSIVLAVTASFGWYGLGWLLRELRVATGGDPGAASIGAPFGGLYWLMTLLLPGYGYFRYPAKLLVVAALGFSVLAAGGFDRVLGQPSGRFRRGLLWLGGVSLAGAIAALAIRPFWHGWLAGAAPNVLFGPLDTAGAANDVLGAFTQTAVLCGVFWWLLGRHGPTARTTVPILLLLLVALDLAVANRWLIACAPASQWERPPKLAALVEAPPPRVYRHPIWMRPHWKSSRSTARLAEAVQWDRDTLWPKYNLAARAAIAEVHGTMMPYDYATFLRAGKQRGESHPEAVPFSLAKYLIYPGDKVLSGAEAIAVDVGDVSLWRNPCRLPRAWIVHQVDVLSPLGSNAPDTVRQRTEAVLFPDGRPRDLHHSAVVEFGGDLRPTLPTETESPHAGEADRPPLPPAEPRRETCHVVRNDPHHVEIEAELQRPGLVVLCDQFYPGWRLDVETAGASVRTAEVLRTNRVMRGVWLPAGRHRLVYRYRPTGILCGAILSSLGWMAVGLGLLRRRRTCPTGASQM